VRPARLLARGIPTGRAAKAEGTLKVERVEGWEPLRTAPLYPPDSRPGQCGSALYLPDSIYTRSPFPRGRRPLFKYAQYSRIHRVLIWVRTLLSRSPASSLHTGGPVMGFSTALLALAHVLAANAGCDSLPSCGTCLANSGCGWCASSTSCMSIASDGTVEGTCSDFQGSQCVGGSRDSNSFRTLSSHQAVPIDLLNSASA
jgi:hypothetical protein